MRGFYIMKFEMSQGDYAAFLNTLDARQAAARFPTAAEFSGVRVSADNYRYSIRRVNEQFQAAAPSRANNWMNWEDGIAFCDWAGLRPMSELEFEKACRGPRQPVNGEYAWGTTTIAATTGIAGIDGSGSETPLPVDANTHFSRTLSGPLRAGIHLGKATREARGESFYGLHDLSGNVVEMAVNISSAAGRGFHGEHGDGLVGADGRASDVPSWPRIPANPRGAFSTDYGFGYRGGDFWNPELDLRISSRNVARFSGTRRLFGLGFRGVRTAGDAL